MISVLVGIGAVIFSSIAMIALTSLSIEIVLEIATTVIAFFVSGVCLRQIHQEHEVREKIEYQLTKSLFAKVRHVEPEISNYFEFIRYLENRLATYEADKRIHQLESFQRSQEALELFILRYKQELWANKTLKDLGLSW